MFLLSTLFQCVLMKMDDTPLALKLSSSDHWIKTHSNLQKESEIGPKLNAPDQQTKQVRVDLVDLWTFCAFSH